MPRLLTVWNRVLALVFVFAPSIASATSWVINPDWQPSGPQGGALFGTSLAVAGDVNGDGYSDVIVGAPGYDQGGANVGAVFLYLGSSAGPGTVPAWIYYGGYAGEMLGYSVSTAGDVNGDGFDDIAVGSRDYSGGGQSLEGRALVFYGSTNGPSSVPDWAVEGNLSNAKFGTSVAAAGDVNGDGFADVAVGAPGFNNGQLQEGRVFVFHGSAGGLATTPAWTWEMNQIGAATGSSVSGAGDFNGDGYGDLVVAASGYDAPGLTDAGAYLVFAGSQYGLGNTAWYSSWVQVAHSGLAVVAGVGDLDGDGFADIAVGAPNVDWGNTDDGIVWVVYGSPDSNHREWLGSGEGAAALFGQSVSAPGDLNGDGLADLVVGSPGQAGLGRVYIYVGNRDGLTVPDQSFDGSQAGASFGAYVANAGDSNGDGFTDLLIGAPHAESGGNTYAGTACLVQGSGEILAHAPTWSLPSDRVGSHGSGDFNGDGYSDIILGSDYMDTPKVVDVYNGSASGPDSIPAWSKEWIGAGEKFGSVVTSAGDVNGDGYEDALIGAPFDHVNDGPGFGYAHIFLGGPEGLADTPAWSVTNFNSETAFGSIVKSAGDVNGDGFSDVLVCDTQLEWTGGSVGQVYVYHGSVTGPSEYPDDVLSGYDQFGTSTAVGDLNGDGFSDLVVGNHLYESPAYFQVYFGSDTGLVYGDALWIDSVVAGYSVGNAGDMNGDGFSDFVVDRYLSEGSSVVLFLGGTSWPPQTMPVSGVRCWDMGTSGNDINGDGYSDLLVNADSGDIMCPGDERICRIYLGSPEGTLVQVDWTSDVCHPSIGRIGDVNGDGFSDCMDGSACGNPVYSGNLGPGVERAPRQFRSDDSAPIALLGRSDASTSFRLKARGRVNAAHTPVRLEWEARPLGVPFDGTGLGHGSWVNSGTSGVDLDELVGGLAPDTQYKWRARIGSRSPFFPRSPWFSLPGNARTEADLVTAVGPSNTDDGTPLPESPVLRAARMDGDNMRVIYGLPRRGSVRVAVYDPVGRERKVLLEREQPAGEHELTWDLRDGRGNPVASGVYFLRLVAGDRSETRKAVVVR